MNVIRYGPCTTRLHSLSTGCPICSFLTRLDQDQIWLTNPGYFTHPLSVPESSFFSEKNIILTGYHGYVSCFIRTVCLQTMRKFRTQKSIYQIVLVKADRPPQQPRRA